MLLIEEGDNPALLAISASAYRSAGGASSRTVIAAFRRDIWVDIPRLGRNGIGASAALDPDRRLDIVIAGCEHALVGDDEDVERLPVPVRIKAEANRKMPSAVSGFLDLVDLVFQQIQKRTRDVLACGIVHAFD